VNYLEDSDHKFSPVCLYLEFDLAATRRGSVVSRYQRTRTKNSH